MGMGAMSQPRSGAFWIDLSRRDSERGTSGEGAQSVKAIALVVLPKSAWNNTTRQTKMPWMTEFGAK